MTSVAVATEDEPSEEVAVRMVLEVGGFVSLRLRKGGFGYLRSRVKNFSEMSRHHPVLLLTDLDQADCPVELRDSWLNGDALPPQFFFRVVVREIESWILADRAGLARYLGVRPGKIPGDPDSLRNPKATLLAVASLAPSVVRSDMVVQRSQVAGQGLGYNSRLVDFVQNYWDIEAAASASPSLGAAMSRLNVPRASER